jgi:LuxR family maltose regulon positive regulatory protein
MISSRDTTPDAPWAVDAVPAKICAPAPRPGSVSRTALVNRLRVARARPLVVLVAPGGYGKTTLIAQWAERDERPFAWVSIDERDDEPAVLRRHVAAALERSIRTSAVTQLTAAMASLEAPSVIVLDDVSRLSSEESLDAVAALVEHVPDGSTLVLAGRTAPKLPLAALRARGLLYEIGPELLALSRREARLLLRTTGIELPDEQIDELLHRTEGWAAGLYLAALALQDGDDEGRGVLELGGDDRYLADYFRAEFLSDLEPERLEFLRRASVLERMSGPLCDAVLERTDSALELEALAEANMLVFPLDRRGESYRFHRLFRDLLRRELRQHEPGRVEELNRRAATWCETHDAPDDAVDYAIAAGDLDRVARLLDSRVLSVGDHGQLATVERWLEAFPDASRREQHPSVAVLGAWVHTLRGRAADAERWLAAAERAATGAEGPLIRLLRAALCRDGVEQMVSDAEAAVAEIPADSGWRPIALLLDGAAHALAGDDEHADTLLADAADEAEGLAATGVRRAAISERAVIAAARADHGLAEALALEARELAAGAETAADATVPLEQAVSGRALLRRGRWDEARVELAAAEQHVPRLTRALPWLAVQTLIELTRAQITLRDADAARAALEEVARILRRRPHLGGLAARARELEREVEAMVHARGAKQSGLTAAELRLLPLLATHLNFREIGERLLVSRNTVKTQAISIYRKLGVSSRSDAIVEASRLGLV